MLTTRQFVYYHTTVGQRKDIFGQLWKEYALSDSRYMVSNTFVVSAEALSATMIGPLALLTAYLVASKSTYRYQFQALVSTLHIYSDTLYYATSAFDFYHLGINHCRPELYYFWVYYVGMNAVWIVVPGGMYVWQRRNPHADLISASDSKHRRHKSSLSCIGSYGTFARHSQHRRTTSSRQAD